MSCRVNPHRLQHLCRGKSERALRLLRVLAPLLLALLRHFETESRADDVLTVEPRVSIVGTNGMPRNIVERGSIWNFGSGALQTHNGWQYAAYWNDARQVSVARRKLPDGRWHVLSLPDYERSETGDRGLGGAISRGFGDGHEKVAMGISADGHLHLSFDHHLSTLRYRVTKVPVAAKPTAYTWSAELFGPVQNNLGGPRLDYVTYPSFRADGESLSLYLRMGGGSGAANSHILSYTNGRWVVNSEPASQFIDQHWSGGDGTVNAYPYGWVIHNGRWHLAWCWRDTPDSKTCHDLCYAYSDDHGRSWHNNEGEVIGVRGETFITADSPGVTVWQIPTHSGYRNGGSMAVDRAGRVHVLTHGGNYRGLHFIRDPASRAWSRAAGIPMGQLVASDDNWLYLVSDQGIYRSPASRHDDWMLVASGREQWFDDSKMQLDRTRATADGWISVIGQSGKTVRVVDYALESLSDVTK